jgi:hypothetical protein
LPAGYSRFIQEPDFRNSQGPMMIRSLKNLFFVGCLFFALASPSIAMMEISDESSPLYVLDAADFWDATDGSYRLSSNVSVRVRAVDFIDRTALVQRLNKHFNSHEKIGSDHLNTICLEILKSTAWGSLKWVPFLGANFCMVSLLTLTHHNAAWAFPGLEDMVLLADIIFIVRHYTCNNGNAINHIRKDLD